MTHTHQLENWKQYMAKDDYDYLIQFVENVKNNVPNNKMIVLQGPGCNGKSTLMREIKQYLNEKNTIIWHPRFEQECHWSYIDDESIWNSIGLPAPNQLSFIYEMFSLDEYVRKTQNLIKNKRSFIMHTKDIHPKLLNYSKIIEMNHVFD